MHFSKTVSFQSLMSDFKRNSTMAAIRECFKSLKITLNLGPFILTFYRVQPKIGGHRLQKVTATFEKILFFTFADKKCVLHRSIT